MLTLSTGDHHPSSLETSAHGKDVFGKGTTHDPGKSYPPISFKYLENDQFNSHVIPRRPTAFSSKRGHSALLVPVDKLKTSPLGDTGNASSITVGMDKRVDWMGKLTVIYLSEAHPSNMYENEGTRETHTSRTSVKLKLCII